MVIMLFSRRIVILSRSVPNLIGFLTKDDRFFEKLIMILEDF